MKKIIITLGSIIIILIGGVYLLFARMESNVEISKRQAIDSVSKQFEIDRVVEVDIDHEFMRSYYEITIVDKQGREIELKIDARTAKIVEVEIDD